VSDKINGPVRIGLIGAGNMGCRHAEYLLKGEIKDAVLTAVCDNSAGRLTAARSRFGERVKYFADADSLMSSGAVDGGDHRDAAL
jgi:predicted dehydrogenase